jgi:hypothetical protein
LKNGEIEDIIEIDGVEYKGVNLFKNSIFFIKLKKIIMSSDYDFKLYKYEKDETKNPHNKYYKYYIFIC